MTNLNFIKTLTAGVALTLASCPQAWAACPSGYSVHNGTICKKSDCGGKCTYYYDTQSSNLHIEKNYNVGTNENVVLGRSSIGESQRIILNNVTIGEGITGSADWLFGYGNGSSTGTLTLPSTFKSDANLGPMATPFYNIGFGTIDASALKDTGISMPIEHNQNVILDPNSNVEIKYRDSYGYPGAINIICKGKKSDCHNMVSMSVSSVAVWQKNHPGEDQITTSYYTGLNKDGNWEVWSDDGLALYADSTLQKPLGKYDFEGNQTGVYKYDGAGNLTAAYENGISTYKRTSYTPAEAAAAVKKGNDNKITFTFK